MSVFEGRIAYGQRCISGGARQSLSSEAGSGKYDDLFPVQELAVLLDTVHPEENRPLKGG